MITIYYHPITSEEITVEEAADLFLDTGYLIKKEILTKQQIKDKQMDKDLTGKVLAVDGDIIAYRSAAVCEEDFEGACEGVIDTTLENIATETGVGAMRIYLSGRDNFRYALAKTKPYKGNRDGIRRPQFLNYCNEYLIKKYGAVRMHGYEADDGIATDMVKNGAIHCGHDKDILQIAGLHYYYVKKEWVEVSEDDAKLNLYRQVLMGDNSDNIPGLPRVGEKGAEKVIFDPKTAHEDALSFYREICSSKLPGVNYTDYFHEQYGLIKMIEDVDMFSIFTTKVEARPSGFLAEEDGFVSIEEEVAKKSVRL